MFQLFSNRVKQPRADWKSQEQSPRAIVVVRSFLRVVDICSQGLLGKEILSDELWPLERDRFCVGRACEI